MKTNLQRHLSNLSARVRPYFDLPVIGQPPLTTLMSAPGFQFTGNVPDLAALALALQATLVTEQQGNPLGQTFQTVSAASVTLTNLYNLYLKLTTGAACTVTLDSAYNIVNLVPFPYLGQVFTFSIQGTAATTVATPTLLATDVTLAGTTTVTTGGMRQYSVTITQLATTVGATVTAGTTFTSIAQVGSSNLFTVTLGTNAIVPVVGTAILINVTAGTLPPGWYPIVKVTSATSFVIATPPGTVWTATAATIPGTGSVPSSAFTPGLTLLPGQTVAQAGQQGLYAPLITVTGLMGMAAGVMVT
jgi:hypothetical protein